MSKRKKRRRAKKHTPGSAMRRLKRNTERQVHEMGDKIKFVDTELKMSAVLIDFMEPYRDEVETLQQYKSLVGIAAFAWNAALLPPDKQVEAAQQVVETMSVEIQAAGQDLFIELLERKQRHFAHFKRMIVHYEVTETRDDWHLAVASTLTPEEIKQSGLS